MPKKLIHTFAAVKVEVFVGDNFAVVVFVTVVAVLVFGFNAVERTVDVIGADLTRDAVVDDVVDVVVFVALTRDVVLPTGFVTVLQFIFHYRKKLVRYLKRNIDSLICYMCYSPSTQWNSCSSCVSTSWLRNSSFLHCK